MQPPVMVIAHIPLQRESELPFGGEARPVDQLGLQGMKERFHVRGVARRADPRGTLANPQRPEPVPKGLSGIFAAAIAVKHKARAGGTPPDGGIEHGTREPRVAGPSQCPGEYAAGALIEDDGETAPPATHCHVGDIAHPDAIGPRGRPRPQPVGVLAGEAMERGIRPVDLGDAGMQARGAHEALHAATADRPALRLQIAMKPRTPYRP